jgi:hypothetical protein
MSEFELLNTAGDNISGNFRLIYGSGPTDPGPVSEEAGHIVEPRAHFDALRAYGKKTKEEARPVPLFCPESHFLRSLSSAYFSISWNETGGVFPEARATYCGVNVRTKGERDIRGLSAEERRSVRHHRSRLIIDDLEPWLRAKLASIGQKTKLAQAIRYALSRWNGLTRFLDDGRIEIDSNVVERSIRPIATTRSLCLPSSSAWKHWKLILGILATRTTCSRVGSDNGVGLEIRCSNLVGRARHYLLGRQNAILNQPANAMMRDAKLRRGSDMVSHSPFFSAERYA